MTVRSVPAPPVAPDPTDPADLAARLRLAVMRLNRKLRRQVAGGLTPSQISTLATTDRIGTPTLGELAAAEMVQPPSMTRTVASLEGAGMLERLLDPTDGRVARVRTTAEGRRTLQRIRSMRTALLARRLRLLSDDERRRLADVVPLLERLVDAT
jgi:DNA-binding MarR family transcriptional regulator